MLLLLYYKWKWLLLFYKYYSIVPVCNISTMNIRIYKFTLKQGPQGPEKLISLKLLKNQNPLPYSDIFTPPVINFFGWRKRKRSKTLIWQIKVYSLKIRAQSMDGQTDIVLLCVLDKKNIRCISLLLSILLSLAFHIWGAGNIILNFKHGFQLSIYS